LPAAVAPATSVAVKRPCGVAFGHGTMYFTAGRPGVHGGRGGAAHGTPATEASLQSPDAVTVDRRGNLLVSTQTSQYVSGEVSVQGTAVVQAVGGATGTFYGQHMVPGGLYTGASTRSQERGPLGSPVTAAPVSGPVSRARPGSRPTGPATSSCPTAETGGSG
jgi:hypothetical protein